MKRTFSILAVALLATAMLGVTSSAGVTKVMVIHVTSTNIIPGQPGYSYPEPGVYVREMTGKVIEVADNAAEVLVAKGDILVSDVFGENDVLPEKGDILLVAQGFVVNEDGSETDFGDPIVIQ